MTSGWTRATAQYLAAYARLQGLAAREMGAKLGEQRMAVDLIVCRRGDIIVGALMLVAVPVPVAVVVEVQRLIASMGGDGAEVWTVLHPECQRQDEDHAEPLSALEAKRLIERWATGADRSVTGDIVEIDFARTEWVEESVQVGGGGRSHGFTVGGAGPERQKVWRRR